MQRATVSYGDVVRVHACRLAVLCRDRLGEVARLAGFPSGPDGSNGAATAADVARYVTAVETVAGPVAAISARLVLRRAASEAGLPVDL